MSSTMQVQTAGGPGLEERRMDDQLMVEIAAGSQAAIETLMQRHRARIVRLTTRLIGDAGHAEDIAQETFVRVIGHAPAYEGRGQFTSWLQTIARRLSLNALRTRRRRPEVSLEEASELPGTVDPATSIELDEVRRAMARLPERQRQALWLRARFGKSYREIGLALGCSDADVANAIFRGRENLARLVRG